MCIEDGPEVKEFESYTPTKYKKSCTGNIYKRNVTSNIHDSHSNGIGININEINNIAPSQRICDTEYNRKRAIIDHVNAIDPGFRDFTENDYKKSMNLYKRKKINMLEIDSDNNRNASRGRDRCRDPVPHNVTTDEDYTDENSIASNISITSATNSTNSKTHSANSTINSTNSNTNYTELNSLMGITIPLSFMREILTSKSNIKKHSNYYHVQIPNIGTLTINRGSKFNDYLNKRHRSEKYYKICLQYLNIQFDDLGRFKSIDDADKVLHITSKYILQYYKEKYNCREIYKKKRRRID